MELNILLVGVAILVLFAVFDLMVGVSNDAVNFLNSSFGSKVASRKTIMIIASLGILAGVTFSSGMMEVARKGIFHPQFFTMPNLLTIFLAVMITDILLLDLFNTHGLPTSTTVSIVFELLGAAVAMSVIKIVQSGEGIVELAKYINTAKAITIIMGILMSVGIAFILGAIGQFISRLIFTFDYKKKINRYGALWGGVALASITFFILIKGSKGSSFMTPETVTWIKANSVLILSGIFVVSTIVLQLLQSFTKVNILKPIILIGTFALAMAFAANDLVNFIGVPLAGVFSYKTAIATDAPLTVTMFALSKKVQSNTLVLLFAGLVMVVTLWLSKKARTVTKTEIGLSEQDEVTEKFESFYMARVLVRLAITIGDTLKTIIPKPIMNGINARMNVAEYKVEDFGGETPSFDYIRASVNLMVASAVVSFATSMKLPLSTTYVTFMVAMGTSFADQAWGRESAVYRVSGVMTVIGGWFMTAFMAFSVAFIFANIINYFHAFGVVLLLGVSAFVIWKNHHQHKTKEKETKDEEIFNLKKVKSAPRTVETTFEHTSIFLEEIRVNLNFALEALYNEDLRTLSNQKKSVKKIQKWSNIITANSFKALRLLLKEDVDISYRYYTITRSLQKIAESYRDILMRSYLHISNNHEGLLEEQKNELKEIHKGVDGILHDVHEILHSRKSFDSQAMKDKIEKLDKTCDQFDKNQIDRIRNNSSKTRLSILYYSIMSDMITLSERCNKLVKIFDKAFTKQNILNS